MSEFKDKDWFYLKPNHQEQVGPVNTQQIRFLLANNKISTSTLVWTEGMQDWEEVKKIPTLHRTERVKTAVTASGLIPRPAAFAKNNPEDPPKKKDDPEKKK